MKKNFIIISNGGGGIATFQYYLIKNIINRKDRVFLIDKQKNHTLKYFNKSESSNTLLRFMYFELNLSDLKFLQPANNYFIRYVVLYI